MGTTTTTTTTTTSTSTTSTMVPMKMPIANPPAVLKVIDLSAVALAKVEAEARETDKALRKILKQLGVST